MHVCRAYAVYVRVLNQYLHSACRLSWVSQFAMSLFPFSWWWCMFKVFVCVRQTVKLKFMGVLHCWVQLILKLVDHSSHTVVTAERSGQWWKYAQIKANMFKNTWKFSCLRLIPTRYGSFHTCFPLQFRNGIYITCNHSFMLDSCHVLVLVTLYFFSFGHVLGAELGSEMCWRSLWDKGVVIVIAMDRMTDY